MKKSISIVLLLIALVVIGFFYKRYQIPPSIDFPQLELTNQKGEAVSLNSFSGKPILINFYTSWCGPCMREMPSLMKVSNNNALQVICISDESPEIIAAIAQRFESNIVFLRMKGDRKSIGVYSIPTTYLINKEGKKVFEKVGEEEWTDAFINEKLP